VLYKLALLDVPCRVIISPEKAILCSTPERS
jgi:hypothetical protein